VLNARPRRLKATVEASAGSCDGNVEVDAEPVVGNAWGVADVDLVRSDDLPRLEMLTLWSRR
jgi:hypothetical protein